MKFNKLHENTDCNCIENAVINDSTLFARKINKPLPLEKDFLSKWEKAELNGHLPDFPNCKDLCGFKGISINAWTNESQQQIIDKYLTTFKISPKHKDSIFIFKLKKEAGLVEFTPNRNDRFHFDLFKTDDFELELLDTIDVIYLKDYILK